MDWHSHIASIIDDTKVTLRSIEKDGDISGDNRRAGVGGLDVEYSIRANEEKILELERKNKELRQLNATITRDLESSLPIFAKQSGEVKELLIGNEGLRSKIKGPVTHSVNSSVDMSLYLTPSKTESSPQRYTSEDRVQHTPYRSPGNGGSSPERRTLSPTKAAPSEGMSEIIRFRKELNALHDQLMVQSEVLRGEKSSQSKLSTRIDQLRNVVYQQVDELREEIAVLRREIAVSSQQNSVGKHPSDSQSILDAMGNLSKEVTESRSISTAEQDKLKGCVENLRLTLGRQEVNIMGIESKYYELEKKYQELLKQQSMTQTLQRSQEAQNNVEEKIKQGLLQDSIEEGLNSSAKASSLSNIPNNWDVIQKKMERAQSYLQNFKKKQQQTQEPRNGDHTVDCEAHPASSNAEVPFVGDADAEDNASNNSDFSDEFTAFNVSGDMDGSFLNIDGEPGEFLKTDEGRINDKDEEDEDSDSLLDQLNNIQVSQ
eukprot:Nk52_evm9s545 gene=Nk52_evmTU9s545